MPERTRLLNMGADSSTRAGGDLFVVETLQADRREAPPPRTQDHGCFRGQVDHRRRNDSARATIQYEVDCVLESGPYFLRVRKWNILARQHQRRREDRLFELGEKGMDDTVIRNAHADGLPAWVLQTFRHFAGSAQYEGIAARHCRLQQPELPVIHAGVLAHLGEVPAYECEGGSPVNLPDGPDALDGVLVRGMASERVARIGGIHDDMPRAQHVRSTAHKARLWIVRMNGEELGHRRAILKDEG